MDDDVFDSSEDTNDDEIVETTETSESKTKASRELHTRRKIEDYFEEKRLREQLDSFGF